MSMNTLTPAPAIATAGAQSARPRWRARLVRFAYRAAVLGLIALNGWWWWEDRPTSPTSQLARLVGGPRNADAKAELRRIVRKSPHDAEALTLLARALGSRGDTKGCAEFLHRVPFWSPTKPEALYGEGLSWLECDQARRAEAAFRQYLADDPNHPESSDRPRRIVVEEKLLNLLALENRWGEARDLIHEAHARADPVGKPIWLLQGLRTYLERANPASAIEPLRRYVAADPEDIEARRALARAAAALKLDRESDRHMAVVLAARPRDPKAWRDALEILFERSDLEAVARALAKAPPEIDTDGPIWRIRGQVREQEGDIAAAAVAYRHAVALLPFDAKSHYRLSLTARRLGHRDESDRHGLRHIELDRWNTDLKKTLDDYSEALQDRKPEAVNAAIEKLARVCRGLGLEQDAKGWADQLEMRKNPGVGESR